MIIAHPFVHDNKTMVMNIYYRKKLLSIIFEVIIILSEAFSLYYLILFYYALKKPLAPHKYKLNIFLKKTFTKISYYKNNIIFYFLVKLNVGYYER